MKLLKLLLTSTITFLKQNIDLLFSIILLGLIGAIITERYNFDMPLAIDLILLSVMSVTVGIIVNNALNKKKLENMLLDQVKRESEMLDRFRATINDMMRVNNQ